MHFLRFVTFLYNWKKNKMEMKKRVLSFFCFSRNCMKWKNALFGDVTLAVLFVLIQFLKIIIFYYFLFCLTSGRRGFLLSLVLCKSRFQFSWKYEMYIVIVIVIVIVIIDLFSLFMFFFHFSPRNYLSANIKTTNFKRKSG